MKLVCTIFSVSHYQLFLYSPSWFMFDKVMSVCCVVAGGGGTLALIIMAGVDIQFPVGVRIIKN